MSEHAGLDYYVVQFKQFSKSNYTQTYGQGVQDVWYPGRYIRKIQRFGLLACHCNKGYSSPTCGAVFGVKQRVEPGYPLVKLCQCRAVIDQITIVDKAFENKRQISLYCVLF
jgi:hypothetical protein